MTEGLEAVMEEFDIREATPEDAEKIIRYLMDNSLKWNLKIKTASDGQNTK